MNRKRIWWCPTGPLVSLPIHAAGVYGQGKKPGSCISDFVVSSYTPTVGTLLEKFEQKPNSETSSKVLILSQPNTPCLTTIPGARSETHAIRDRLRSKGIKALLLEDDHATVSRVAEEMPKHNWVHFAGHAVQDQGNPLRSGIILHDGRLDFAGLFTTEKMPYAAHAFLSACQTSTGDQRMPEEGLHLASAMLVVGYRSVVATMWSIRDKDAPSIADKFYACLLIDESARGHLDEANSARALDEAVKKVRDELNDTEDGLLKWVPYAHFGVWVWIFRFLYMAPCRADSRSLYIGMTGVGLLLCWLADLLISIIISKYPVHPFHSLFRPPKPPIILWIYFLSLCTLLSLVSTHRLRVSTIIPILFSLLIYLVTVIFNLLTIGSYCDNTVVSTHRLRLYLTYSQYYSQVVFGFIYCLDSGSSFTLM